MLSYHGNYAPSINVYVNIKHVVWIGMGYDVEINIEG